MENRTHWFYWLRAIPNYFREVSVNPLLRYQITRFVSRHVYDNSCMGIHQKNDQALSHAIEVYGIQKKKHFFFVKEDQ